MCGCFWFFVFLVFGGPTEEGGVAERLDGDAGGDGPAEQGEQVHGHVRLQPVVVERLGLTAATGSGWSEGFGRGGCLGLISESEA